MAGVSIRISHPPDAPATFFDSDLCCDHHLRAVEQFECPCVGDVAVCVGDGRCLVVGEDDVTLQTMAR